MTVAAIPPVSIAARSSAAARLDALRDRIAGRVIVPGDADYDEARCFVRMTIDRRPSTIVRAANADDVAATVAYARAADLPLAVRSGGHGFVDYRALDGALLLDLSRMKRIEIDPTTRTARVQPAATSGDLAGPAHAHGLALSTGDTHSVGMGGLTTGGGIGYMVRKYGLAIDNLLAAQVVTAAGDIVTASADEHPDLFWAIRGGGGNFGVVTEFTFRLAPVKHIIGGELLLPASRESLRGYLDYAASAPDDLTTIAALLYAPPAPHVPEERVGELALSILACWTGDPAAGEQALAPLRALGTPIADAVTSMPYPAIYRFTEHYAAPHGASVRMMFADDLSDHMLDAALATMTPASSPFSLIQFRALGGAMARVPDDATAFAHRDRRYFVAVIAVWLDANEDAAPHEA